MIADDFPRGYQAIRALGEGSMGSVWLAYSEAGRGHCAVKVLDRRRDRRGSAERSFNREVRALARLEHPAIAGVLDFGRTEQGSPFLAMEYVEGPSLHAYMRGRWRWGTLWLLLDRLLAALGHAHARELVHRDLKPGNVLVQPGRLGPDAVRLVDFGIALAVPEASVAQRRIEGTPAYIAPEAAAGNVAAIGPWTDLYSLGVLLFELLTGDLPYHGRHLLAHHQRSPVPEIKVRPTIDVPPGFTDVVRRLMEKAPEDRYLCVADVRHALAGLGPEPRKQPFEPMATQGVSWDDEDETPAEVIVPVRKPTGTGLAHLRLPPLAGREVAKKQLWAAAERALKGEGPRVVLIEGEAGLGKSSLVGWLREQLEERGSMRTMKVPSEPQTRSAGLREAILRAIGAPTASRREVPGLMARALTDPRNQDDALAVLWPEPGTEGNEARVKKAAWLIRDLARQRPFLLLAEDAHWSPEGRVLQLIRRLARPDGDRNMLLVATLRPTERGTVNALRRALLAAENTDHIVLAPLSPRDLAPALETLGPLPPGIAEAACVQAAGNPLLALEAMRAHLEAEGLGEAPCDPAEVIGQRIAQVAQTPEGSAMRSVLARATLLGRTFTLRPLARLCRIDGEGEGSGVDGEVEQLAHLMELAVNQGFAVEQSPGRWRFSHDLLRQEFRNVARALPNWGALNLAAARLKAPRAAQDPSGIELEVLARHHWEGDERVQALELGLEGVQKLHAAGHMGNAASFVRRLIEWDDQCQLLRPEERCELRLLGSDAAEHAGQPYDAERHADAAVGLARRNYLKPLAARAASRLGLLRLREDDFDNAEKWLLDGLRFARESKDPRAEAEAQLALARFYRYLNNLVSARIACERALEMARDGGVLPAELRARGALARLDRLEGQPGRAAPQFRSLANAAAEAGFEVIALDARLQEGLCAWAMHDADAAAEAFEEVIEGARGNLFTHEFFAAIGAAWAHAARRRFTDCELALMQAEDLRFDVRLTDPEAGRLRHALRLLAEEARRPDIIERIDRLAVAGTRTRTHISGHDEDTNS